MENNKSAVRLQEIGPRMTLQLMKIEEGLLTGEVLYHDHIVKTEEEKEALRKMVEKKKKLKEQRKKQQAENRARKLKEQQIQDKKSNENNENSAEVDYEESAGINDIDDDAVYYKDEVGEDPDEELFKSTEPASRKRPKLPYSMKSKKPRLDEKGKKAFGDKEKNGGYKSKKSFGGDKEKNGGYKSKKFGDNERTGFKGKKSFGDRKKSGAFKDKKSFKFNKKK